MHNKSINEFLQLPPQPASPQGRVVEWLPPLSVSLNDAAKSSIEEFDRVITALLCRGASVSISIEGDMEPGKLPEVVSRFFLAEGWSHETRYRVAEVQKLASVSEVKVGTLIFDAGCCPLGYLLIQGPGVRWMSNLRVVATVSNGPSSDRKLQSPFNPRELEQIEEKIEMLLRLDGDLTHISAWLEQHPSGATWAGLFGGPS